MYTAEIKKQRLNSVIDMVDASSLAGQVHVEESKLRIEQPIKSGQSQYRYDLKTTDVDGVVTHSLDRNDVFVPSAWQFFVGIKNKKTRVEKLYPFVPVSNSQSVYAMGFVDDQLEAIYAGYVQWMIDQVAYLSSYPMEKFHKVPAHQPQLLWDNANNSFIHPEVQLERNLDDYLELIYPRLIIAGTRDHKITVNFDAANLFFLLNDDPENPEYEANIVLFMDGFLIKGGCENGDKSPFGDAVGNW